MACIADMVSTSIPQIAGQRLLTAFSFIKRPREQIEYGDQKSTPTATREGKVRHAPERLKEIDAEAEGRVRPGKLVWLQAGSCRKSRRRAEVARATTISISKGAGSTRWPVSLLVESATTHCSLACGPMDPGSAQRDIAYSDSKSTASSSISRDCLTRMRPKLPSKLQLPTKPLLKMRPRPQLPPKPLSTEDEAAAATEAAAEDESAVAAVAMKRHIHLIHEMEIFQSTMHMAERIAAAGS